VRPTGQSPYAAGRAATKVVEQLPPIGTDRVLDRAQIRYCLSEDIRLEAARTVATADVDVERFNSMINDFNARCSSYQYRRQVFDSVQREVQSSRASLQVEGVARFQR